MITQLLIACMLTGAPTQIQQTQKDTTIVVVKFPQMKKPTWSTGGKK